MHHNSTGRVAARGLARLESQLHVPSLASLMVAGRKARGVCQVTGQYDSRIDVDRALDSLFSRLQAVDSRHVRKIPRQDACI